MSKHLIDFIGISKSYDSNLVLDDLNLYVRENEFLTLLGPSGCGKTTLLNIIAGLETVDSGEVTIEGQRIIGPGPDRAVIFQQYALYPWMTVLKNVMFPLKFQRKHIVSEKKDASGKSVKVIKDVRYTKKEKEEIARKYIKMVDLEGFEDAFPSRLSGGMKQRVAIARAYVGDAEVLLMDEPTANLDYGNQIRVLSQIRRLTMALETGQKAAGELIDTLMDKRRQFFL